MVFPNVNSYQFVFCLCELVSQNLCIWFLSLLFLNFIPFKDWIQWCLGCFLVVLLWTFLQQYWFSYSFSLFWVHPISHDTPSSVRQVVFHSAVLSYISRGGEKRNQPLYPVWWVGRVCWCALDLCLPRWRVILSIFSCLGCLSIWANISSRDICLRPSMVVHTYHLSTQSEQILFFYLVII